jgi:hypothetical protein
MLNIKCSSCWRDEVAQSVKWQHWAIQLKFDQLSAAVVFSPCPCWSSILLLHIRVKQPDMWNWPPTCMVKNEWTFTSTSFCTFLIPYSHRKNFALMNLCLKVLNTWRRFSEEFLVVSRSLINICNSLCLFRWKWNHPTHYTTLKAVAWIIIQSIKTLG